MTLQKQKPEAESPILGSPCCSVTLHLPGCSESGFLFLAAAAWQRRVRVVVTDSRKGKACNKRWLLTARVGLQNRYTQPESTGDTGAGWGIRPAAFFYGLSGQRRRGQDTPGCKQSVAGAGVLSHIVTGAGIESGPLSFLHSTRLTLESPSTQQCRCPKLRSRLSGWGAGAKSCPGLFNTQPAALTKSGNRPLTNGPGRKGSEI